MKNILLVSHCGFPGNSAVHVHHFANELVKLGLDCVVAVPSDKGAVASVGANLYKTAQFDDPVEDLPGLYDNQTGPDIVHAWTPREHVRKYCATLEACFRFKLVIHLEDNEEAILERYLSRPFAELAQEFNDRDIPDHPHLSHPKKYPEFLASADGVTIIMDRLQEFVPAQIPVQLLWPGADTEQFSPRMPDADLARSIGIPPGCTVLCYPGNVHPANVDEIRSLYRTVGLRNLEGKSTVLIRTGGTFCEFLSADEVWTNAYIIDLGFVERRRIPDLLALADVLIQPGCSDPFNDYRLPSKIPEFLAMGKPVILPATNIGRFLTDQENAIVLPAMDPTRLSDAIDLVLQNKGLAQRLSDGAVEFAKGHLDWSANSQQLRTFYHTVFFEGDELISLRKAFSRLQREARSEYLELRQIGRELREAQAELRSQGQSVEQIHGQLVQARRESIHLRETVEAMERSSFWKARKAWFQLKSLLGLD
jgi:glycosyltransferase involved in cell wall biosynthesis